MYQQRLESLTRALAHPVSRRAAVRAFAGGVLGSVLSGFGHRPVAAACRRVGQVCSAAKPCCAAICNGGVCTCRGLHVRSCNGRCRDLSSNENHCGACNQACGSGKTCCGGHCVDLLSNAAHCGGCHHICRRNEICRPGSGHCCVEEGDAEPGQACCHGFVCNPPGENCVCVK